MVTHIITTCTCHTVKLVSESTTLLGALDTTERYSFCMCNPPFFKDNEERYGGSSRSDHRPAPSTFSGATAGETVTEGGEEEFVKRIIRDSLVLNKGVRCVCVDSISISI